MTTTTELMKGQREKDWEKTTFEPGTKRRGRDTRLRTAAIVAGLSLLAMAVIAGLSNFAVIGNLIVPGDAEATAANIAGSAALFRLGAAGLLAVAVLDVLVAWGLYLVLRAMNPSLSLLGAWLRVVFAAIFAVAINSLFAAAGSASLDPEQTLFLAETFERGWQAGLIFFGLHLGITGALVWRYGSLSWIFGVLLIVAGAGYVLDALVMLLGLPFALELSMFTFVGEVVFIFWLLIRGGRAVSPAG
ncbi:MAG: DUF4386 domain-containing protein [Spirochaetales bacterium]|nr:DUF4386 domain-containing protein [Spirochaetales bacterium]